MSDQPTPLSIEQVTHLLKLACTPYEIGVLQALLDAFFDVLTELELIDSYISPATKDELERFTVAVHTITSEPTIMFEGEEYQITVPADTLPLQTLDDNDDLKWLDRFLPSDV